MICSNKLEGEKQDAQASNVARVIGSCIAALPCTTKSVDVEENVSSISDSSSSISDDTSIISSFAGISTKKKKRVTWAGLHDQVPTRTKSHRKIRRKRRAASKTKNLNTYLKPKKTEILFLESHLIIKGEEVKVIQYRTGKLYIYRGANPRAGEWLNMIICRNFELA